MEMLPLAVLMLATGAIGGVFAWLLGVGGNIVIVPVLDTALDFALISPMTVLTAPIGAKIARRLSKRRLGTLFGCCLFIVACRMIYRATFG